MEERERPGGSTETKSIPGRRLQNRRTMLKAAGGTVAGVPLAGCLDTYDAIVGDTGDPEPITIGVLAPDPDSDFIGRSMVRAAELAVDELNDSGGIDGRDVELAIGDTKASPLEAKRQYQRLVLDEGADVTVGMFASEALMNIMDNIAEQETIHLTSGAATTAASRLVNEEYDRYKYHFRAGPYNDADLGLAQIDFLDDMAADLGLESIVLFAEDYEWTREPWEIYQNQLPETPVNVAMEKRYPPATDDFSDLYDAAQEAGADMVFITTAHTGNEALLDWSYPNRPDPQPQPQPFAFGGIHVPMQLPAYYDLVDGACEYALAFNSATAQSEITDRTQPFVTAYQDEFDGSNPVYTGYHTYDAVKLFADVVEQSGTLDADELVDELEDAAFTGAAGTAEFYDRDHEFAHDLVYRQDEVVYFQWQENDAGEGAQEVIWPEEHATTNYVAPEWLR